MPARINERTIAGPAYCAAAAPVRTKMPAPIIAPIPREISDTGPRVRLRLRSPDSPASCIKRLIDFFANSGFPMRFLLRAYFVFPGPDSFQLTTCCFLAPRLHSQYTGTPSNTINNPGQVVSALYRIRTTMMATAAMMYNSGTTGYPNAL